MKTAAEMQKWLRERIAAEIKTAPEAVSTRVPLSNYGLDSIVIVTLATDLEDWLNVSLDPTIFWEYPTIEALSEWLAETHLSNR